MIFTRAEWFALPLSKSGHPGDGAGVGQARKKMAT